MVRGSRLSSRFGPCQAVLALLSPKPLHACPLRPPMARLVIVLPAISPSVLACVGLIRERPGCLRRLAGDHSGPKRRNGCAAGALAFIPGRGPALELIHDFC